MSTDANTPPGPDGPDAGNHPESARVYRDNQQQVDQGVAVMGAVGDHFTVINGGRFDDAATNEIFTPRLREGPYPAHDVQERLRGFVEPPAYARCRKALDSRILVLRAGRGTGASTTAFALLAERHGAGGITGLDTSDDLSRWRPKEPRGYLLQGLAPELASGLGEVVLTGLAGLLLRANAHLVITVRAEVPLPHDTSPWQVTHHPPLAADVAAERLRTMARAGDLTEELLAEALGHLASAAFTGHLHAHPLPEEAVDVADGLRDLVTADRPVASVLTELQAGSSAAAHKALSESRHQADRISLMAAISLLDGQDRTVVEEFSAVLRPLITERAGPPPPGAPEPHGQRDLLGPALSDRLEAVGARLAPPRFGTAPLCTVQPVVFSGRHRSDALLRCLWLEYEGMNPLLWKALDETPHRPGIELAAGRAIGRALTHATGPSTLRQLKPFADSERRWRRRLVAYALGEMVEHPPLTGAVREQLGRWSRSASVPLRCTVAETCAGKYGLARPAFALKLLDTVLSRPDTETEHAGLRSAVSFALSVLVSEKAGQPLVLDRLRSWQMAGPGTQQHTMAVHIINAMSRTTFPVAGAPGHHRLRLADLLTDHFGRTVDLVVTALDDPATYEAVVAGLFLIEDDPALRQRTSFPRLLRALSGVARSHRGVLRFVLRRHRARTYPSTEGFAS
ncbi:hypothetical protein GT034_15645 [Streptomyces sp. SID2563]|uniref:hypothetical protein n=1 Tax=Streptomyces sp. SID2563 TaxID=2690255 RepID=UPI0013691E3F|nr:hypothetical protein [Streptomyces sp. SID2563]MYW09781.1 hypothetical protein [Streptomyces sp. SID2563]